MENFLGVFRLEFRQKEMPAGERRADPNEKEGVNRFMIESQMGKNVRGKQKASLISIIACNRFQSNCRMVV